MKGFARWLVRHRGLVILVCLVLMIPSVLGMAATKTKYDLLYYLPQELETVQGQEILLQDFGKGAFSLLITEGMPLKELELGALPIINENDSVATDEIGVGDNDTLGALVAVSVKADLLIVLTDIDGLYTADPRHEKNAVLIPEVRSITAEMLASAGGHGTALSTGGMATKLSAAKICMEAGTDMIILNGARPNVLYDILDGKSAGTRFIGRKNT